MGVTQSSSSDDETWASLVESVPPADLDTWEAMMEAHGNAVTASTGRAKERSHLIDRFKELEKAWVQAMISFFEMDDYFDGISGSEVHLIELRDVIDDDTLSMYHDSRDEKVNIPRHYSDAAAFIRDHMPVILHNQFTDFANLATNLHFKNRGASEGGIFAFMRRSPPPGASRALRVLLFPLKRRVFQTIHESHATRLLGILKTLEPNRYPLPSEEKSPSADRGARRTWFGDRGWASLRSEQTAWLELIILEAMKGNTSFTRENEFDPARITGWLQIWFGHIEVAERGEMVVQFLRGVDWDTSEIMLCRAMFEWHPFTTAVRGALGRILSPGGKLSLFGNLPRVVWPRVRGSLLMGHMRMRIDYAHKKRAGFDYFPIIGLGPLEEALRSSRLEANTIHYALCSLFDPRNLSRGESEQTVLERRISDPDVGSDDESRHSVAFTGAFFSALRVTLPSLVGRAMITIDDVSNMNAYAHLGFFDGVFGTPTYSAPPSSRFTDKKPSFRDRRIFLLSPLHDYSQHEKSIPEAEGHLRIVLSSFALWGQLSDTLSQLDISKLKPWDQDLWLKYGPVFGQSFEGGELATKRENERTRGPRGLSFSWEPLKVAAELEDLETLLHRKFQRSPVWVRFKLDFLKEKSLSSLVDEFMEKRHRPLSLVAWKDILSRPDPGLPTPEKRILPPGEPRVESVRKRVKGTSAVNADDAGDGDHNMRRVSGQGNPVTPIQWIEANLLVLFKAGSDGKDTGVTIDQLVPRLDDILGEEARSLLSDPASAGKLSLALVEMLQLVGAIYTRAEELGAFAGRLVNAEVQKTWIPWITGAGKLLGDQHQHILGELTGGGSDEWLYPGGQPLRNRFSAYLSGMRDEAVRDEVTELAISLTWNLLTDICTGLLERYSEETLPLKGDVLASVKEYEEDAKATFKFARGIMKKESTSWSDLDLLSRTKYTREKILHQGVDGARAKIATALMEEFERWVLQIEPKSSVFGNLFKGKGSPTVLARLLDNDAQNLTSELRRAFIQFQVDSSDTPVTTINAVVAPGPSWAVQGLHHITQDVLVIDRLNYTNPKPILAFLKHARVRELLERPQPPFDPKALISTNPEMKIVEKESTGMDGDIVWRFIEQFPNWVLYHAIDAHGSERGDGTYREWIRVSAEFWSILDPAILVPRLEHFCGVGLQLLRPTTDLGRGDAPITLPFVNGPGNNYGEERWKDLVTEDARQDLVDSNDIWNLNDSRMKHDHVRFVVNRNMESGLAHFKTATDIETVREKVDDLLKAHLAKTLVLKPGSGRREWHNVEWFHPTMDAPQLELARKYKDVIFVWFSLVNPRTIARSGVSRTELQRLMEYHDKGILDLRVLTDVHLDNLLKSLLITAKAIARAIDRYNERKRDEILEDIATRMRELPAVQPFEGDESSPEQKRARQEMALDHRSARPDSRGREENKQRPQQSAGLTQGLRDMWVSKLTK